MVKPCLVAWMLALGLLPSAASAQNAARDSAYDACLARDTSTAWMRISRAWADHPGDHWANDSLRQVLVGLAARDQGVRLVPALGDSMASAAFVRRMVQTDSADAKALQAIIDRYGWPTRSLVGVAGAGAAFLIAQHNRSLQPEAMRLMAALPDSEYSRGSYAMMEDRIRVARGLPQRFGTQLSIHDTATFDPIEDLSHLDQRRTAVGLPPLDVYICMIRVMYGRPVRDPRTKR